MSYSLRIQKGALRGKRIEAPPPVNGKSNVTPSLLKEALFQILHFLLEEREEEAVFFDLCAGSGQIGFEALSCGFKEVHLCELDPERFGALVREVKKHDFAVQLHRKDFIKMVPRIVAEPLTVTWIDLPYSFWGENGVPRLDRFFSSFAEKLSSVADRKRNGFIFIQGPSPYTPSESPVFSAPVHRQYRHNWLTQVEFRSV